MKHNSVNSSCDGNITNIDRLVNVNSLGRKRACQSNIGQVSAKIIGLFKNGEFSNINAQFSTSRSHGFSQFGGYLNSQLWGDEGETGVSTRNREKKQRKAGKTLRFHRVQCRWE